MPTRSGYSYYGQSVNLRGGTTYLYTAWIWNQGMEGGSNINYRMKDGTSKTLTNNAVINIGNSTPSWQVFTCRFQAPENVVEASFVPVVRGAGAALYDNLRVTVFEGSDFAAEAVKVRKPPTIDGKLDDWNRACPIPLIGRNQLRVIDKNYAWTPQNLSGVAYLDWDSRNLYVAVEVLDNIHHPAGDGETVITGDSVILAFDPTNRSPDAAARSCAYYVSSQKPAGGSGTHTLYRPSSHSGGRPSGHLARDSSVHEIVVKTNPKGLRLRAAHSVERAGGHARFRRQVRLRHPTERQRRPGSRRPHELGRRAVADLAAGEFRGDYPGRVDQGNHPEIRPPPGRRQPAAPIHGGGEALATVVVQWMPKPNFHEKRA